MSPYISKTGNNVHKENTLRLSLSFNQKENLILSKFQNQQEKNDSSKTVLAPQ